MATDPVPALLSLIREKPDPRAVSNWIIAYLGKRPRFTEEQIVGILKEHEAGAKTADVCRIAVLGGQHSRRLIVNNDIHERSVDFQGSAALIVDETEFTKLIHEKIDPRSGRANPRRQDFLVDVGDSLHLRFLADVGKQQQYASKPLLTRIEQMVDQFPLELNIP